MASCAWYQFTIDREGEHPVSRLAGYKGWVYADGYSGFNGLFGEDKADEMACMAHVRRKFVDVFASQGNAMAEEAIRRIAELFAVENDARGKAPEERVALRQTRSKPIFDDLEAWLHAQVSFHSNKWIAPSNPEIKQLGRRSHPNQSFSSDPKVIGLLFDERVLVARDCFGLCCCSCQNPSMRGRYCQTHRGDFNFPYL